MLLSDLGVVRNIKRMQNWR